MSLWWVILAPFLASALAAVLPTRSRNRQALLAGAVAVGNVLALALLFPVGSPGTELEFAL